MAIGKITKGSGFTGAIKYDIEKQGAEVIVKHNLFSERAENLAAEMRAVANSNPRCTNPVFHGSLSLPAGEYATDEQWMIAGSEYLKKMGWELDQAQYIITRHSDSENDHIHILANRVQLNGKVVSDSKDFERSKEAVRAAEKAAGLSVYQDQSQNLGKRFEMRFAIDEALKGTPTFQQFKHNLEERGINAIENRQSTGRLSGLSFEDQDGRVWKGSEIGKHYSANSLIRRGLQIDHESDAGSSTKVSQSLAQVSKYSAIPTGISGSTGSKDGNVAIMLKNSVAGLTAGQKDRLKKDREIEL